MCAHLPARAASWLTNMSLTPAIYLISNHFIAVNFISPRHILFRLRKRFITVNKSAILHFECRNICIDRKYVCLQYAKYICMYVYVRLYMYVLVRDFCVGFIIIRAAKRAINCVFLLSVAYL